MQAHLVCSLSLWCALSYAQNYRPIFEATTWTEWQNNGFLKWSKRLPLEYRHVIAHAEVRNMHILFALTEQCLRNDRIDITLWYLGKNFAIRRACDETVTTVIAPDVWGGEMGTLPPVLELGFREFRREMFTRTPRNHWRL